MKRPVILTLVLILPGLLVAGNVVHATAFSYHDYDAMVADLEQLAADYPGLAEHFTAQDRFSLLPVTDGAVELEHHILRITNESLGLDKPEVVFVGVQHGNEVVSLEVALAFARLLLESYGSEPWLSELVDRREIYLLPLANPHGFNHNSRTSPGAEGSEDMNRDHLYDRCTTGYCADEESLSTIGARAIHELARRHLFRVMIDFHGGAEMIIHPWGTPAHSSPDTESPDHQATELLGQRMSDYGGPYSGYYPVGTANDLLYGVNAPLDDTGYATSWDLANADSDWLTDGWRTLSYTVEISDSKAPPAAALGGDADLLTPGGSEDGYVPKNVRIALAAADAIEPYVLWTNRGTIPAQVDASEAITVDWQVRGCFEVDDTRVRYGADPDPRVNYSGQTSAQQQQTGDPCFGTPTTFTAEVSFATPGTYYLAPVARVDASLLEQTSPNPPGVSPQSWLVRSRTEEGFYFANATNPSEVNTVTGQLYWSAEPLAIEVSDELIFADGFESGDTSEWSSAVTRAIVPVVPLKADRR